MYDDDFKPDPNWPEPDPIEWDDDADVESERRAKRRNCLFLVITVILIISMAGTSLIAYFIAASHDNLVASAGRIEPRSLGPTAAPATVIAAIPTTLPAAETELTAAAAVNRIAIINGEGQIETMSPTGEDRRVLTLRSDNAFFQFPAWAPDGRRLAVVGGRSLGGGIYVLEDAARTGTLEERQIYFSNDNAPFYLYWSPDSRNVAFLANNARNLIGLNVVAGDGSDDSRLLATGSPFYWDWSNDGRQLLIHSGRTRSDKTLALIDIEGGTRAGNLAVPGDFQAPGIGQDGRYWAFAEQALDGLSALVVVDTQTGERRIFEQAGSLALSWSPAQDHIAFTNGAIDSHPFWGPLRWLDVATEEIRLLSTQTVLAFFWSPDGRSIAFITLSRDENDDSINAYKPDSRRRASRVAVAPIRQPNRGMLTLSVVEVETGNGMRLLDFQPTAVYLSQFLPFFDQYALSHRIWSPDSGAIVLPVREDDSNTILIVPVDGGRPYRLADGEIAFWSHN